MHVDVTLPAWNFTNMNGTKKTKTEKQVTFECKVRGSPKPTVIWLKVYNTCLNYSCFRLDSFAYIIIVYK